MLLLTSPEAPLLLPKGSGLPPIIPVRWRGNPNARIIHPKAKVERVVLRKPAPEPEYVPLPSTSFKDKVIFGSNISQKCRMCGGRPQCKLSAGFMDLCTPKPVPKGVMIIDGCAIFIHRKPRDIVYAPTVKRRPVSTSAIDIDESDKNVTMKVKVLKLWDARSDKVAQTGLVGDETGNVKFTVWESACQPQMQVGKCYRIHNATTGFFGGSYQIQATNATTITELKNEVVRPRTEFIRSPTLSMLRDDVYIPEAALRVPGINEPKPRLEDYSSTPFLSYLDDIEFGDEEHDMPSDIDPLDRGLKLKKALNSLYVKNPVKAKEAAAKLTKAQWKSIDKIGGLHKDLTVNISKAWEEPEPEGKLRATEAGFVVITKKDRQSAIDVAQSKKQDKFMINHGFRLKDKLEDMMFRDPAKAKVAAAKLTMYDWHALNYIGGLNTSNNGTAGSR